MITVYVKTGCPWCLGVTSFLRSQGIEFTEKNVFDNPEYMKEMEELSKQTKAPVVIVDGFILADTDKDAVSAYLAEKGLL